ncbi:MAG: carbonic anhydrase [Xenococcaceae cyanobacterium MO_188.B29]|nr:carbonic anhydrase [Xenococcaceae cyanobacterium MO_188.B29]
MHRRSLLKYMSMCSAGAAFSLSYPSLEAAIASQGENEWGYGQEDGPQLWGELSPDFSVCQMGQQQSPIDLRGAIATELAEPEITYREIPLKILNNGHTIQVNTEWGNRLILDGQDFELLQFHFHHPSEHMRESQIYAMELHFVHRNAKGEFAVLGVLLQEGKENETLQSIWDVIPTEAGEEQTIDKVKINIAQLLPAQRTTYRYFGSLTTPPCSELVYWVIFEQPIEISKQQVEQFAQIFPWNARPIQSLNRRFLLKSL